MAKLTEAEASLRWCPFVRMYAFSVPTAQSADPTPTPAYVAPSATGGPANRWINASGPEVNPENCRCIGSQCMMWVWIGAPPNDLATRQGCCGLAHDRN